MADFLFIDVNASKKEKYEALIPQINSLIEGENDLIANCANVCAALKQTFHFFWIGFYFNKENQLVLGPFQGPIACTRIPYTKGVCGASYTQAKTIIVPDVDKFPGHIACSSDSKSEIVVPVFANDKIVAVLDVDSDTFDSFDEVDKKYLEKIVSLISK